jgi:8-demethyl-8-alpha-L-rhamnosyltetracenomycin-C 2'-O-methyltransferase
MKLEPIAAKYGSDKCSWHSYGRVYDQLFEGKTVRKVLEIGIGYKGLMGEAYENGASLQMWAEYFPKAEIYGLDIRREALINEGRIHSFQCDQGKISSLLAAREAIGDGFDLIVDDGSHQSEHQVLSACVLWSCVALGGCYVIEDVWSPEEVSPFIPFPHEVRDLRLRRVKDDRMIISKVS